jgi:hypothetical protein
MTVDLEAIRARAMVIRDVRRPREERAVAGAHASDDMLAMADEIERLRACLSPDAADLAEKLRVLRLRPVPSDGPVFELHKALSHHLARFVSEHGPKRGKPPTWDIGISSAVVRILMMVDDHLQAQLKRG